MMMIRQCVICGTQYVAKRRDSNTCGKNACRCKLSRLRKKAHEDASARLFSPNEQQMLIWLNKHVPTAELELRTIYTIYGKEAFQHAAQAVRAMATVYQQRQA
jgi:hypothetical protein